MEIKFDPKKIKVVDTNKIRPNTWNPKDKGTDEYEMVKKGIAEKGLEAPIYVRTVDDGYEILDGEQRWTACSELGFPQLPIYDMGRMSDQKAKEWTLWFDLKVPKNEITLAHLLGEMRELPGLSVPFTPDQVENYARLAEFDFDQFTKEEIQDVLDDGMVTISVTKDQKKIIDGAKAKLEEEQGQEVSEGRALELICADYLAS